MGSSFDITAIIAAFNEVDVIRCVVQDLNRQGIFVHLLDHGSTDGTADEVRDLTSQGLLRIERFAPDNGAAPGEFSLRRILRRKEEIARELGTGWIINHDADELRESPWPGVSLNEGIRIVDQLGYNSIDFEVLEFQPTHDRFQRGDDLREQFPCWAPTSPWNKVQVRCWKQAGAPVDLLSSGGHEAAFSGRRVFPLRFLLRHYPFRSQQHGERKLFGERRPRYAAGERNHGWHIQYDALQPGHRFTRRPEELETYDAMAMRAHLQIHNRLVEQLEAEKLRLGEQEQALVAEAEALRRRLQRQEESVREVERALGDLRRQNQELQQQLQQQCYAAAAASAARDEARTKLRQADGRIAALAGELEGRIAVMEARECKQREPGRS